MMLDPVVHWTVAMARIPFMLSRIATKAQAFYSQRNPELLDPERIGRIDRDSLLFYFGNIHSQRGQDGILAEIFRRLNINRGRFVEFGAWDGAYLSNCRYLYEKGWGGFFIEGDAGRFRDLLDRYAGTPIRCVNAMVSTETGSRVSDLIGGAEVDFVSIDIDGNDLEAFIGMGFNPPVVLMEGGFNFAPALTAPLPINVAADNIGQPIAVICARGAEHGYTPVCFYQDVYFVRTDLADLFRKADANTLFTEAFNFMPESYRQSLLKLRARWPVIRHYEEPFFGHFSVDPLGYTMPVHAPARL